MSVINNSVDARYVYGTSSEDQVTNTGDNVTIVSYAADDVITDTGKYTRIDSGSGNDLIYFVNGELSIVDRKSVV